MLLVKTRVAPSRIHGLGVMAAEPVRAGEPVWRFEPGLDLVLPRPEVERRPAAFRTYVETYGYLSPEFPDAYVLSCDHAKFLNHAEEPNTVITGRVTLARCDLAEGDEITCDYRDCVLGWTGFT